MKRVSIAVAAMALAAAGTAFAGTQDVNIAPQSHHIYVVADILPNGHVAAVHPYERLSPGLNQLLRKTVASWVTGPAIMNGRRAYTQVLFHVALQTEPLAKGQYSAKFSYLAAEPYASSHPFIRSRFPGASWGETFTPTQSAGTVIAFSNRGIVPTRP